VKKLLITALLLLVTQVFATAAHAYDPPETFRGHKWGTGVEDFPGAKLDEESGERKFYVLPQEKLSIGDARLTNIGYGFYRFDGSENHSKINETLRQTYGKPSRPNQFLENYIWSSDTPPEKVRIVLSYNDISDKGIIGFSYKPIKNEEEQDKKEAARKGAKDL